MSDDLKMPGMQEYSVVMVPTRRGLVFATGLRLAAENGAMNHLYPYGKDGWKCFVWATSIEEANAAATSLYEGKRS